jgi:hypothetical protein
MCGKNNPDDQDVCRFCGARLRPVWETGQSQASDADLPDWLTGLGDSGKPAQPEAELPDWLSGLRDETGAQSFPSDPDSVRTAQPQDADADASGWLKGIFAESSFSGDEEAAARPLDDLPDESGDWLSRIGASANATDEQPEMPAGPEADDWAARIGHETPDWLKAISDEPPATGPAPAAAEELPDWLKPADEPSRPAEQVQSDVPDFETPDWLKEIAGEPDEIAAPEPEAWTPAEGGEDLPAWLTFAGQESPPSEPEPQAGAQDFEISAWLSQSAETSPQAESDAPQPAGEDSGMLSWLDALEDETQEPAPASETPEQAIEANDLSWLDDLESTYSGLAIESDQPGAGSDALTVGANMDEDGSLERGDLPAWLMGAVAAEPSASETVEPAGGEGEESGLKVEELPSWLQAMRPVGPAMLDPDVAGDTEPQPLEGAGPLAGLRGVLPAEPDIAQVEKPPVYSARLRVSEAQEVQAKMLADLLEAEVQPREALTRPALASTTVMRVAIALALMLALLAPIVTGLPAFLPPVIPPEVAAVHDLVGGLPTGAPVLVAIDYDPGFSAEMDAIARTTLAHVISAGAVPVMISTTPTGPMQAERLIGQVAADSFPLAATQDYINLGFVPGGAMGISSFIQSPGATLPLELTGLNAWSFPALQGVDSLAGFRLILVATESSERARSWIEQIQSQAGALPEIPPLVMLVSAQTAPMVRPYYQARPAQVQGLVSGLDGALAYETGVAQRGPAAQYWSPFNVGLAIAALLMFLGAMINLLAQRLPAGRKPQEVKPS